MLAHAGEACTPTIGNLPKLFRAHSLAVDQLSLSLRRLIRLLLYDERQLSNSNAKNLIERIKNVLCYGIPYIRRHYKKITIYQRYFSLHQ